MTLISSFKLLCFCLLPSAICLRAMAQGTAFTYQGRLDVNGTPANGVYDFIFQAFDAASAGNSLGGTGSVNGVDVTNGQFTAQVDLGAIPFTGPARWLQIAVSTNGAGSYSTLSPRQPFTVAPYSIYAGTASTVANGAIGNAQLSANSVAALNIQDATITSAKIGSGQVVKSVNGLADDVSITQGANVTINTVGNSVQISAPAGGLALPYSGSVATGGDAFSVLNSLSGNYGQLGKSSSGVYGNSSGTDYSAVRGEAGSGAWGVFGTASERDGILGSTSASGANGYAGVRGKADSADGVGVRGNHVPSGNYGQLGTANQGVYGASSISGGLGVRGDGFGNAWGLYGTSDSVDGIYGFDGASAGASYAGVRGVTASPNAAGVRGNHMPTGNYGQLGTANEGVLGRNGQTGNYGQLGGYFSGVTAVGNGPLGTALTIDSGAIRIPNADTSTTTPAFIITASAQNASAIDGALFIQVDHPLLNSVPNAVAFVSANGKPVGSDVVVSAYPPTLAYFPDFQRWFIVRQNPQNVTSLSDFLGTRFTVLVIKP